MKEFNEYMRALEGLIKRLQGVTNTLLISMTELEKIVGELTEDLAEDFTGEE